MEDDRIIELFFERSEQAIIELSAKYEKLLFSVSNNILINKEDAMECVNDTYLGAWKAIPPQKPNPLTAFLCKIVRNLSLNKYRDKKAGKRNSAFDVSMEELEYCIPSASVEEIWSAKELGIAINRFLATLDKDSRIMFLRRYWFLDSASDIADLFDLNENNVYVKLFRIRKGLKSFLEKEGFHV